MSIKSRPPSTHRAWVIAAPFLLIAAAAHAMDLLSAEISEGGGLALAQVHGRCGGGNHSPALSWSGAPPATRSFAVTMFDPDADAGKGFWHWIVYDIPAGTSALAANAGAGPALPPGAAEAENDFGERAYGGACPPSGSGVHHYRFTLYALAAPRIPDDQLARTGDLAAWLNAHALASAGLTAVYSR